MGPARRGSRLVARSTRPAIERSVVATGRGDDGTTGLFFGGRIGKDDPRTEAYGTIDEAVAVLGLARAAWHGIADLERPPDGPVADLPDLLIRLQRELFVVGAELAANPDAWDRLEDGVTRVDEGMLAAVERELARYEAAIEMPREFLLPGSSLLSAAIELARTVLRRAERRSVALRREGLVAGEWLVPYLNRVADLLWVVARAVEQAEGSAALPATARRRGRRAG